ncbi:hypothetical protein TKV_c04630 [Thermoanaerobacter kivui]|uniref:Uncharacterized protein n=1 Tax=Thermoanaerobacter kivui TaxID=2325 RepID=A0A097APC8_THEKI|nr:hypothetical protein TKV_c04630 [Thermoanaerobacter kivui]
MESIVIKFAVLVIIFIGILYMLFAFLPIFREEEAGKNTKDN